MQYYKDVQAQLQEFHKKVDESNQGILGTLKSILNFFNPLSEDFFAYKFIELLGKMLEDLFIPSEERLTAISNTVTSKFAFIDSIKEGVNSIKNMLNNLGNSPVLESTNIESKYYNGKLTIIDMSWYAPFKNYGDLVITGFAYLFFVWRLFITLPNTINAVGGSSSGALNDLIDIQEWRDRR